MQKYHFLAVVVFLATAVLGLREPYRQAPPEQQQRQPPPDLQERAYLDYEYDQVDDRYVEDTPPEVGGGGGRLRARPNPRPSVNSYYQTDCKTRERTLPHEKYCDHFYQLNGCSGSDDQAILRSCPNGLIYTGTGRHGLIGVCDFPHRTDCAGGKEKHNPPLGTEHCDWLYGIFGHETSCTRYWTCWNGTATEQFCIGGLLYNEETHACDWPQNVSGCQKHPLCKDDPNGNVPLGKSCNRYWACQGGYPRLQRCPAMLVFDKERKRCIAPPTKDCDVPATTPSPQEENGGRQGGGGNGRGGSNNDNRRRFQEGVANNGPLPFQLPDGVQLLQRPNN